MRPPGDPSHLLGKVIDGRYEILQLIGEGGMGVVYKARQTSIDRLVAIKMLSSHLARDPSWVQRFNNEARAVSRLQHPNTIRLFDFGQTREGMLFMAMEFLDGLSLRQVISQQSPMDPQRVLRILMQCCASLSEAHNLGIIHRDIKADNVFLIDLLGSRDHVKLLDFGVAKLMMAEDFATQVGVVFGTPQYMSPEQGRGEPLTPRSDLYGVGILAYEMLTGTVPFTDPVPLNVLQMHLQSPVPPLPSRVPPAVQQLVMRALEKDPGRRYATAAAMMEDAQSVVGSLQAGQAGPYGRPGVSGAGPAMGTPGSFPPLAPPMAQASARTIFGGGGGGAPPPPVQPHSPPPMSGGSNMPTVLDRPNPYGGSQQGRPPQPQPAALAAAGARTVMVSPPGARTPDGPPHPGPGPGSSPPPYPPSPVGGGSNEQRTIMLADTEGIVSMGRDSRPPPGPDIRHVPMPAYEPSGSGAGASAMFWILCLLTGLVVGVGAYWLVLELGK